MSRLFVSVRTTAALCILGQLLCGCERQQSDADARLAPSTSRNELIPLRLKRSARPEPPLRTTSYQPSVSSVEVPFTGRTTAADREAANLEPGADWPTETLTRRVAEQLKQLSGPLNPKDLEAVVAPGFQCGSLRPTGLRPVFRRGRLGVYRAELDDAAPGEEQPTTFHGSVGLYRALRAMEEGFAAAAVTTRFKVAEIELSPDRGPTFTTRVLVELTGRLSRAASIKQVNATWTCTWNRVANAESKGSTRPRLLRIRVDRYAEAVLDHGKDRARTLFDDVTLSALGADPSFARQQLHGIEFWSERVTRLGDMSMSGHHGLAVGDVNGDGLEDLYVCDGGSLPNRLYVQNADGTARDVSSKARVDWLEDSRSALLVDLDGDGDQDLVVATIAIVAFAENDGTGKFSLRGGHRGAAYPFSLSAADYDNDGDLDLHVCVYAGGGDVASGARGIELRSPVPFHDANNGGRNVLLENTGAFRFVDVTDSVGLRSTRWSFAAAWEDYDQDGDPDLYVANDFGRNNLYRNDAAAGGQRMFVDIAAAAGVEDTAAGMSVAWGDYNRDGRMDIYVGNMFSAAGNRVAYQRTFSASRQAATAAGLQRMARGNSLFAAGEKSAAFTDVSSSAGVTMGRWAWSSAFVDLNNDGWEDIVVSNGYLTNERDVDL